MRRGTMWLVGVAAVGCGPKLDVESEGSEGAEESTATTRVEPGDPSRGDDSDDGHGDEIGDEEHGTPDFLHPGPTDDPDDDQKPPSLDCSVLDPSRVYMTGTVWGDAAVGDAVIHGESCVGFELGIHHPTVRDDGTVSYAEGQHGTVSRFVQDDWFWDEDLEGWRYPQQPEANDLAVAAPCVPGEPSAFVVRPSDDAVVYACPDGVHRDQFGETVVDRPGQLLSIDPSGAVLFAESSQNVTMYGYDLIVLADGQPLAIELEADFEAAEVVIWRRHEDGWWVVFALDGTYHRLFIDVGVAEYEGEYSTTPAEFEPHRRGRGANALDGEGHLYQTAHPADADTFDRVYVLYRTLHGDATQILYSPPEPGEVGRWADVEPGYTSLFSGG